MHNQLLLSSPFGFQGGQGTYDPGAAIMRKQAYDLNEQRKLIEDLGASLKVDNKPAERNSSIFDKVKDIFG